jgi:phosphatidylglycerol:prolipoprotein diacylglycerol transferase
MMYLVGFGIGWWLGRYRARHQWGPGSWDPDTLDNLLFYCVLGTIIGGRIGYMLFYGSEQLLANPLVVFRIWEGGMSFHGGLLGVIVAMVVYSLRWQRPFFEVADFVTPLVPLALLTGRIGNFINGELWGRVTTVPWGMQLPCLHFPTYCLQQPLGSLWSLPRHPSQLYEAFLEGFVLFIIIWLVARKPRPLGLISGLFLTVYGVMRFAVEFVREPDLHLGYIAFDWLTMGQVLSVPMMVIGLGLIAIAQFRGSIQRRKGSS